MVSFWVIGGADTKTGPRASVGAGEDWIGPFQDYESALQEWAKHARQAAEGGALYRIQGIDPDEAPRCTD